MKTLLLAAILALGLAGSIAGCTTGCPGALAQGELVARGGNLELQAEGGQMIQVVWPDGLGTRQDGDTLVLTDWLGSVKARQGDVIGMGGGYGIDDIFHGCGDLWVIRPG